MDSERIERLMLDLKSVWPDNVRSASHALVSLGNRALVHLLQAIEDGEEDLRQKAALVIKQMHPREALPDLIEVLTENSIPTASKTLLLDVAIHLFDEQEESKKLFALLIQLSNDKSAEIRRLVASGLGRCSSIMSYPILQQLSRDRDPAVSQEALTQLSRLSRPPDIELSWWDVSSVEAIARLRVRSGLATSRINAIEDLLEKGQIDTEELRPLLDDAGEQTFEEMSPVFQNLDEGKASALLIDIIKRRDLPTHRRMLAWNTLRSIKGESTNLQELYRFLLDDPIADLRLAAIKELYEKTIRTAPESRKSFLHALGELIGNSDESVRLQASKLMHEWIESSDQLCLRYLIDALHRFPCDHSRLYLMKALSRILEGLPNLQFLQPELLNFVDKSDGKALEVGVSILERIVPNTASSSFSKVLLNIIPRSDNPTMIDKILSMLLLVLPRNATVATNTLLPILDKFSLMPMGEKVLRLLGRISDRNSLDVLIKWAKIEQTASENYALYRSTAIDALNELEGTLREVWLDPEGNYQHRAVRVCKCGGRLSWSNHDGCKELHCLECSDEYLLIPGGEAVPISQITGPLCYCPGCTRKHPLAQMPNGVYICPSSEELYLVRFDTGELVRKKALVHGICKCCIPPQPLELQDQRLICIRTRLSAEESENAHTLPFVDKIDMPSAQEQNTDGAEHKNTGSLPSMRVLNLRRKLLQ